MRDGFRLVFGDPALRSLLLFGWQVIFYTIPEGIAAPYAASLGKGPVATGLILATTVLATAIGTPLFTRLVPAARRAALMGPLAAATCATLTLTAFRPDLPVSLVIFSASATFGVYQIAANTGFVLSLPDDHRAQAFGIASMGVIVGQGAGFIAAGAAAQVIRPATVIAAAGAAGALTAAALTRAWRQIPQPAAPGPAPAATARPAPVPGRPPRGENPARTPAVTDPGRAGSPQATARAPGTSPQARPVPTLSAPPPLPTAGTQATMPAHNPGFSPAAAPAPPSSAPPPPATPARAGRDSPAEPVPAPRSRRAPATAAPDHRLPIFDSLEAEWFRRTGNPLTTPGARVPAQSPWTSPADGGWRAAQATTRPATGQPTKAGLPSRIPRANLVPGSAGRTGTENPPARSADAARTRMASFQRGTREGRAAAPRGREPQHRWFLQVRPHPHHEKT
jgi:Major Facilitator Superfamily